ncbi:MAG: radical SAM protein [Lachnospiraceae bacterium]|nr:radical SAM protein [Lachnospiraceae bacterium]
MDKDMIVARRLAVIVTLRCTLKCKLCCNCLPFYKETPPIVSKEEIFRDMDKAFQIFDKIEWFQFVGGELFMHPELDAILERSFQYVDQFDKIILMSNGTLMPKESVLDVLEAHKGYFEIQMSDYGPLSHQIREMEAEFDRRGIPYVTKRFYGDIQYYGGWVDCGGFDDRGQSEKEVADKFHNCWQVSLANYHMYRGKIHSCIRSLFGKDLGLVDVPEEEFIDINNEQLTLEEMRERVRCFNSGPLYSCRFCGGFDSKNSKRYPAAEQV